MIIYAVIGWADYLDGIAARVTGQYSRLGTLLDPLIDRLLVVAGVVVCWHFELLPRWALALLAARELFMVALVRLGMRRGLDLKVNWLGRAGVWPVMGALFFAMAGLEPARRDPALHRARARARLRGAVCARRPPPGPRATLNRSLSLAMLGLPVPFEERTASPMMDTFPDLGSLSDQELKDLIQDLTDKEQEVSYQRRILHGKIDILRAELVNRLRKKHEGGEDVISGADVKRLTDILAGRASGGDDA